jgi:hypothetical protein
MASRLLEDKILGGGQNFDDDDNGPRGGDSRRSSRASSEEGDGDVPTGAATGARAGRSHALAAMLADAALDPLGRRDDTGGGGGGATGSSSSGPRAVMADKAWADELEARQAERESLTKWSMARRAAVGVASDGPSVSAAAEVARRREERAGRERANDDDDDRGGGDASREDDDDDDDDEVASLAALREARLRELRALSSSSSSASSDAAAAASALAAAALEAAPAFGSVADIYAQDDLPSLVDDTPRTTVVLCLLWEDYVPASDPWRRAWPLLAARFPHTRFLAMQARVASTHWDPIALPALAVYRGGQTVDTVVRLQGPEGEGGAGLGSAPTAEAIAQWLVRRGWCRGGAAAARTQGRRDERSDGSESEEEEGERRGGGRRGGWGRR